MKKILQKLSVFLQEGKQVMVGFISGVILSICILTGANYVNASQEITNEFLDDVIEYNKQTVPEIDKKLKLISAESIIIEKNEFQASIEDGITLDFMNLGGGTLIIGKANSESELIIKSKSNIECKAKTNSKGKFSCMFSTEILTQDDLVIIYN